MHAIRPWLLVGSYADTRDPGRLAARGVGAMLQLAEAIPQPGIASLYLDVEDGAAIPAAVIRDGMAFVRRAREAGLTVLIACGAGVSRSVAFAAAALKEADGLGVLAAVSAVRARHPAAEPHYRLLASLCAYYGEAASTEDLARAWLGGPPASPTPVVPGPTDGRVAAPRGPAGGGNAAVRIVYDAALGVTWYVREVDTPGHPQRGPACLLFESEAGGLPVWRYPPDWRALPEAALVALLNAR